VAALCRTGSARRTALGAFLAIGAGVVYWSPRPLAFGLLGLALTVSVVEQRRRWWLLVPIVWVWANSHGSFVLGLVWLVLVAVGEWLDGRGADRPGGRDLLPWIGGFGLGLVAACVNPLGPRLLLFPLAVVGRQDAFRHVAEWRSPSFQSGTGMFTLVCLVGIVVVVARSRPAWRDLLPIAGFLLAALSAQRNLPMLAIVAAPVLARALHPPPSPGREAPEGGGAVHAAIAAALVGLGVVFTVVAWREPPFDLRDYPVAAARLYERPARVATTDVAAGYLILREGSAAQVFLDDRVDLYPVALTKEYIRLLDGRPDSLAILDRHGADVVLWPTDRALSAQLAASDGWRRVGERSGWTVWIRSGGAT
jgi:hypothetical protein